MPDGSIATEIPHQKVPTEIPIAPRIDTYETITDNRSEPAHTPLSRNVGSLSEAEQHNLLESLLPSTQSPEQPAEQIQSFQMPPKPKGGIFEFVGRHKILMFPISFILAFIGLIFGASRANREGGG